MAMFGAIFLGTIYMGAECVSKALFKSDNYPENA